VTIQRGQPWGEQVQSPPDLQIVATDQQLREWVLWHRSRDLPLRPAGLAGGDLGRTVGVSAERFPGVVNRMPVDLLRVEAAGQRTWAVAHVVGFRAWWRGEAFLAMNAEFRGPFDVAPRAHPNDGKVDVLRVAATMPWRQRLSARRRALSGAHLPHPDLTTTQSADVRLRFAERLPLWVDGARWVVSDEVHIVVEADALTVYA
jgi:hypothetical protein